MCRCVERDPRLGTVIAARYRLDQVIGAGTMGVVYEAHDLTTSRQVALKAVPADLGDEVAARLVREAKTLQMLEHRNIVAFIDTGELDDGKFLVTELVRGVTLRALVADGLVEPRRALEIARQVLDAVGHAHRLGVIHRDVSPENIMLADGGSESGGSELVKMLDFGVAKLASDTAALLSEGKLTKTGFECIGTARYMAPEVALGRPVDARADLYSIGAILFELLTGKPPFDDADPVALLQHHVKTPVPMLREAADRTFTTTLEYLVAEALAKTADRRFASAADMSAAVDAAMRSIEVVDAIDAIDAPAPSRDSTLQFAPPPRLPSQPAMRPMPPPPEMPVGGPYLVPRSSSTMSWLRGRRNWVIGGASGLLLVIICIAAAASGDHAAPIPAAAKVATAPAAHPAPARSEIARHGLDLIASGNVTGAITHLESAVATNAKDSDSYLALGHARIKANRRVDAINAYERALKLSPVLGTDPQLATNLAIVLESKDAVAGVLALELLARLARHDAIAAQASAHKVLDVRRRAIAIAERDGFADKIDRVESWSLDLTQLSGCEPRRATIAKLRTTDHRAIPALRRARSLKCIEPDATEAIAHLESRP